MARRPPLSARLWLAASLLAAQPAGASDSADPAPQPLLLETRLNGQSFAEPVLLLRDSAGALWASESVLRQWRLRLPPGPPLAHDGERWHRLEAIPGLRVSYAAADQSLALDAPAAAFERSRAVFGAPEPVDMTPSAPGAFVNYDLFVEHFGGATSFNGAFDAGAFTRFGVGATSFAVTIGEGPDRAVRLDTNWTIDRPSSLTSIRLGDAIGVGGPGSQPLRFAGIQFGRNFAVQPGFVTMPLPALEGSAAVPSVVDILVNNALQGSHQVAPGPFEISQVPVQTGGGTVQLVVRDLLGRQVITEYSYYASSRLLRRGLHDYSFEAGFLRRGYGARSFDYGAAMASTTHRFGLTDRTTVEAHAQAGEEVQLAGAGFVHSLGLVGLVGGQAAVSRSDEGMGAQLAASFERRSLGLSVGLRSEYTSADFTFIGRPDGLRQPRLSAQAFADMPLLGGTVGANLVHRDHRVGEDETLAGLFANFRAGPSASVHLFARHAVSGRSHTVLGAHLTVGLGGRRSASASGEYRRGGSSATLSFQQSPPHSAGTGYRLAAAVGDREALDASLVHHGRHASYGAQAAYLDGAAGVRLSAAGSVGLIGGRPFAARRIGESFAAVEVPGQAGVRVYADNQLIGATGADGVLIVPALRPFDRNLIRIDEADLPLDVQPARTEIAVRPFARSGAMVRFEARRERGALLQLLLPDGRFLPAGAMVAIAGRDGAWPVVSGGEAYVPDLSGSAELRASWDGGSCAFSVHIPESDDPQPRLEGLVCVPVILAER